MRTIIPLVCKLPQAGRWTPAQGKGNGGASNLTIGGYSHWRLPTMRYNGVYATTLGSDWSSAGFTKFASNSKALTREMSVLW